MCSVARNSGDIGPIDNDFDVFERDEATELPGAAAAVDPDMEDVGKYYNALHRAQRDIDLRPELFTHCYLKELPARYHDMIDVRRMELGERIVFESYSLDIFENFRAWIAEHDIFPDGEGLGDASYEEVTVSLAG
jgi:hypothetical protein